MRVAALYDIHGNLPALEAVVAEVEREQPDAIVFGGDIIAGPMPRETLELVREDVARRLREAAGTRSRDSSVIEDLVRPPSREEVLDFFDRMAAEQRGA